MTTVKWLLVRMSTWSFVWVILLWFAAVIGVIVSMATRGLMVDGQRAVSWILSGAWLAPLLILGVGASVLFKAWGKWMRERFVREAPMPAFPKRKLRDAFSGMNGKDADLAERALRQFFVVSVRSGAGRPVAMPSRLVERLWREFAVDTDVYARWCNTAFGCVVAPTEAKSLGLNAATNDALRRTWFWACKEEAINPKNPTRLPLLFALDAKLAIAGGIIYATNHSAVARMKKPEEAGNTGEVYVGASFSDNCYNGDCDNFGGVHSSSSSDGDSGGGGGSDGGGGGGD